MDNEFYAVVMAGGRGARFWPLGRKNRPKQLLQLTGEKTMLEDTVLRLFPLFSPERILIVTSAAYIDEARRLLPIPPENVVGEPAGRDTAPCVALALGELKRRGASPDAVMTVLPADHLISPAAEFRKQLRGAMEFARKRDVLMTLGVRPTYPATGYGYICCGNELEPGFHAVERFVEKPPRAEAERYLAQATISGTAGSSSGSSRRWKRRSTSSCRPWRSSRASSPRFPTRRSSSRRSFRCSPARRSTAA